MQFQLSVGEKIYGLGERFGPFIKNGQISVWLNPYIAQESEIFTEGMTNGYFIQKSDSSIWQTDFWQAGMAIIDFTNPAACEWYQAKLEALIDLGIDCFKVSCPSVSQEAAKIIIEDQFC
ncbi:Alpha-xylosidase [Termitomyces sp. J132]|nr:Alpha-xylosidase [Termitomyces sp. J132]